MKSYIARYFSLAGVALLFIGCAGEDEWVKNLPETVEASGVVTLNGDSVEGASVVAAPQDGGKYPAKALTDSDGYFELKAFPAKEGAVPGKYKVMITKTVEINADGSERPQADAETPEMTASGDHAAPASGGWKNALPKQYANPNDSGLTVDIPAGGITGIQFELKG